MAMSDEEFREWALNYAMTLRVIAQDYRKNFPSNKEYATGIAVAYEVVADDLENRAK